MTGTLWEDTVTGDVYEHLGTASSDSGTRLVTVFRDRGTGRLVTVSLRQFQSDVTVLKDGQAVTRRRYALLDAAVTPDGREVVGNLIPAGAGGLDERPALPLTDEVGGLDDVLAGTGH